MEYIVYRRFRGRGIGGEFNLRYGTVCREDGGVIYAPDGRAVCVTTSENGWEHFHPHTKAGERRQKQIDALRKYYESDAAAEHFREDLYHRKLEPWENDYWLQQLRTMPDERLERLYRMRIGGETDVSDH